MKYLLFLIFLFFIIHNTFSQKSIPNITIHDLNNNPVEVKIITNENLTLLSFWATWCLPCLNELNNINDNYEKWLDEIDFKFIAVSIDENRTISRVRPLVNGNGWAFKILLDKNQDLKRALQINNIPYTLIINNGDIVFRHTGYIPGNEDLLFEKLKEFNNK